VSATDQTSTILVTGAAGNLGTLLGRYLSGSEHRLRLMVHRTPLADDLLRAPNVAAVPANLAHPETLRRAVDGADVVIHFAGVLFEPRPERFLPITNTVWFNNLLDACLAARVARLVLISFPHVEGPTTPDHPASGRLDGRPISVHARTRLEEERLLFARTENTSTVPVALRLGMVYGKGLLMVDAARWAARHRLLGVWREPTWIHLVATADALATIAAAAEKPGVHGIYHVGDEQPILLQDFLDQACDVWRLPRPWRMPTWMIYAAAACVEAWAAVFRTPSPLTRDFVSIGRVSYCGDTTRTRQELVPELEYPTLRQGLATLL
jgi:nucleoside-diphosphate-sugar epimerase